VPFSPESSQKVGDRLTSIDIYGYGLTTEAERKTRDTTQILLAMTPIRALL
jgi:hypothetical protein